MTVHSWGCGVSRERPALPSADPIPTLSALGFEEEENSAPESTARTNPSTATARTLAAPRRKEGEAYGGPFAVQVLD